MVPAIFLKIWYLWNQKTRFLKKDMRFHGQSDTFREPAPVRRRKEGFCMITMFIIGIMIFIVKLVLFALKAAWGITKGVLFVIGIPALLIVLFVVGMVSLAVPLLIIGLLAAFLLPFLKGIK